MSLKNKNVIIKELEVELEKVRKEKDRLEKENIELKRILTIFINPHTPPSKKVFKTRTPPASKKLGAPICHKGATREISEPTQILKHFLTKCPKCNDLLNRPFEIEERTIEEIPEPQPVKVTKHIIGFYHCKNCGVVTAETDLPQEGSFGKNTLAHVILMKYDDRLPARKVTNSLQRQHALKLTH